MSKRLVLFCHFITFCWMKFCMCSIYEQCPNETRLLVHPGSDGAVVPAAAQGVHCGENPLPGLSMECLPHCSWGLFLTASSPSPSTIPNWVSFEQLSCILVPVLLPEIFNFPFVCHLNCFNLCGHRCFIYVSSFHVFYMNKSYLLT
jgi:hypothetical protein